MAPTLQTGGARNGGGEKDGDERGALGVVGQEAGKSGTGCYTLFRDLKIKIVDIVDYFDRMLTEC